mgnify:CR=1 FL=1
MSKEQNVYILSGLPGSGKSYFAKKMQQENEKNKVFIFSEDEKTRWYTYHNKEWSIDTIIMDGLHLTNDSIISTIKDVKKNLRLPQYWKFSIIRWNEDRKTCLNNDKNRRDLSSEKTIKNAIFEKLNLDKIKKATTLDEINLIKKKVELKPDYLEKIENKKKYNIQGNYLISEEWTISGTTRSYDENWNSVYSPIYSDTTPDFTELDDYLTEICPNISFLTYKKIKKECVDVVEYTNNDYYSTTEDAYYRCNLEKMFEIINKAEI